MGFEFLGAISRVCHASGGKIRFEVSGPGGKILGLKPLFSLTSSVVMSAKRTPRYVAPHITLSLCSFKLLPEFVPIARGEAPGLFLKGPAAQPHPSWVALRFDLLPICLPSMKKSSTPSSPAPSGERDCLRYHENEMGVTAPARTVR
jgi:hypothetical protein